MQVGLVRVDALKRLAAVMKKRVEGCKHTTALRMLARSCGFDSYDHLLDAVASGCPRDQLLQDSQEELVEAWRLRLDVEFGLDVTSILSAQELDSWFRRVFVPRDALAGLEADEERETVRQVIDPRLYEADWRDSEFRHWIQRQVDRERGHRPVPADFRDDLEHALTEIQGQE